jgi:hypothetical protein
MQSFFVASLLRKTGKVVKAEILHFVRNDVVGDSSVATLLQNDKKGREYPPATIY